jgi:hypothetical protein
VILEFELRPLPRRVRGASLEGAVLRELREHSGWDTSEQVCLKILEWLRHDEPRS